MNPNQILRTGGGIVGFAGRLAGRAMGQAFGLVQRGRGGGAAPNRTAPKPEMDDVTLARKVETEIFRGAGARKSKVNVNAVDGVVWLRGEVKRPDEIEQLEAQVRAIPEVRGVENLLHLPKTPAPTRADTPRRQQRTRSSTRRPQPRTQTTGRITDDRTDAIEPNHEPSPAEHSVKHEGRTPAPLGSRGEPSRDS
ncbi:MAG: BON domain-containing protein [Solirubrobacterales bacterium]|nr:BON domain-containing protein [Solirubrobacterales bacterium]